MSKLNIAIFSVLSFVVWMENNEAFKGVMRNIKELECHLSLCYKAANELETSGEQAESEIEEHFWRCEHALAARKATLLSEYAKKIKDESNHLLFFLHNALFLI
jgi:hypothetical protein